jgi:hypothetical protein
MNRGHIAPFRTSGSVGEILLKPGGDARRNLSYWRYRVKREGVEDKLVGGTSAAPTSRHSSFLIFSEGRKAKPGGEYVLLIN